jgi:hypothetical protein
MVRPIRINIRFEYMARPMGHHFRERERDRLRVRPNPLPPVPDARAPQFRVSQHRVYYDLQEAPSPPRHVRLPGDGRAPPGERSRRRSIRFSFFICSVLWISKGSVLGFKSSNLEAVGGRLLDS